MEIEQIEIKDYLKNCEPLDKVDDKFIEKIVNNIEIIYKSSGKQIATEKHFVYLIRIGSVKAYDSNSKTSYLIEAGHWFDYDDALLNKEKKQIYEINEDSLIYIIPKELITELIKINEHVNFYFSKPAAKSYCDYKSQNKRPALMLTSVIELSKTNKVYIVDGKTTVQKVANLMTTKNITAVLIGDENNLKGIVTDRVFCTEVAAKNLAVDTAIEEIMTPNPITINAKTSGSEALLIMARKHIRHLPVIKHNKAISILTATDLINKQSHEAVFLIDEIRFARNIKTLKIISKQLKNILLNLIRNNISFYDIGHTISSIGITINQKIIEFAEKKLGTPPVSYAWLVAGSMARDEQNAHSDQDNMIILNDTYDENIHFNYFKDLANFVCDALDKCGYVYCPGDIMASNSKWRQPLAVWKKYFNTWITEPEPMALMHSSIFFDLKYVYGDKSLFTDLQSKVLKATKKNTIFLTYMTANAMQHQPPLGVFKNFVLEKSGSEKKALDMKTRGVIPIVDMVRIYALSLNIKNINTMDRLKQCIKLKAISKSGGKDLIDAFEFINSVRLHHQAKQIENKIEPDNYAPPEELSSLEKKHLKDAFEVVRNLQSAMVSRYNANYLL